MRVVGNKGGACINSEGVEEACMGLDLLLVFEKHFCEMVDINVSCI
jgi:hypothetical protein